MRTAAGIPLNLPRPARVRTEGAGVPVEVDGRTIELIRESWLVEDRWWTERPLRRRYWEAVTTTGRNVVVYHDLVAGSGRGAQGPAACAEDGAAGDGTLAGSGGTLAGTGEQQACGRWYAQAA
jgi:hypothetical protein